MRQGSPTCLTIREVRYISPRNGSATGGRKAAGLKIAEKMALRGIAVGLLVILLKAGAWYLSRSVALLSDALESLVNVSAAVITFAAVGFAARPADTNHPYGHEKAELFAAIVEGVLIVLAALAILFEAARAILHPMPLRLAWDGLAVNAVASAINLFWSLVLTRDAARHRSPALLADAAHLRADVVTSAGVILGVTAAVVTGRHILDPIVAALVALHVLWSGTRVISSSVDGLMDAAPAPAVMKRISELIAFYGAGAIEAHDLKTRATGRWTFLEFHLVVPGAMTVAAAHDICDRIEQALMADMDDLVVTIHVEPAHKAKNEGIALA